VKHSLDDTIAAIATPLGAGGVGIIRISGDQAVRISGKTISNFPKKIKPQRVYHGWISDKGKKIDEILYYYMKAPSSYTGEDVVEINCHGGVAIVQSILQLIIGVGARVAEKGEFTKRAFLNKKLDLSQAESVADLVSAPTGKSAGYALQQLEGKLSKIVIRTRKKLLDVLAKIEASIDFPDDIPSTNHAKLRQDFKKCIDEVDELLKTSLKGKVYREGLATVIIGKPNVGKSSLLNALLGEERAIVTEVPGTTRDAIEEMFSVNGLPLRIIDTAGIRHPKDKVEELGVGRTEKEIAAADFIIMVVDASKKLNQEDKAVVLKGKGKQGVVVFNKVDLGLGTSEKELKKITNGFKVFKTSALKGQGIEALVGGIFEALRGLNETEGKTAVAINSRHRECLLRAREGLGHAIKSCRAKAPVDCIAIDLKEAIVVLGEISGEQVSEEVINAIFSRFCVGK